MAGMSVSVILRLIWHWSAGGHRGSSHDKGSYNWLIEHDAGDPNDPRDDSARLVAGVPEERNMRSTRGRRRYYDDPADGYAAHTLGFNSHSLGLAACAMREAVDYRPGPRGVDPGPSPLTVVQVAAMIQTSVVILARHNLEPVPEQLFTHYEAEHLHGVDQYPIGPGIWRWNVTWLPHRQDIAKNDVGDWIREQVLRAKAGQPIDIPPLRATP